MINITPHLSARLKRFKITLHGALIPVIFYCIFFKNSYLYNSFTYQTGHYNFAVIISLTLILIFGYELTANRNRLSINHIDLAFAALLGVLFCSRLNSRFLFFNEILINTLCLASLYLIVRLYSWQEKLISWIKFLGFAAGIELMYSCINYFRNPDPLNFHGFLGNSALSTCFIIAVYPILIWINGRSIGIRLFLTVSVFAVISISQSRAGLLSIIFVMISFIARGLLKQNYLKKVFNFYLTIVAAISVIVFFVYLILLKTDSISGRLIIWKITLSNLKDYILTGVGFGDFPVSYQAWQQSYVSANKLDLQSAYLIDLPNNVFNEPLQILVEAGLIGFTCFLYLIYSVYACKVGAKSGFTQALKATLGSALVFSLFSYPFHSLPVLALVIISLAALSNLSPNHFHIYINPVWTKISAAVLCFISFAMLEKVYHKNAAIEIWHNLNVARTGGKYVKPKLVAIQKELHENGNFLFELAKAHFESGDYTRSIKLVDSSMLARPNVDAYLLKGACYEKQGNFDKAEDMYNIAQLTIPSRLTAKSYLLNLYQKRNDSLNAKHIAIEIINSPMKSFSEDGYRIKAAAKVYLDSKGYNVL